MHRVTTNRNILTLILVLLLLFTATTTAYAAPQQEGSVLTSVPAIPQRFTPPERSGRTWDNGDRDCLAASVAMVLQALQAEGKLFNATTDYPGVRKAIRAASPGAGDISSEVAVQIVPTLTNNTIGPALDVRPADQWQNLITPQLQAGYPVIAVVPDWLLLRGEKEKRYTDHEGHAIVITGLQEGQISYNDSWFGQAFSMPADQFGEAWRFWDAQTKTYWVEAVVFLPTSSSPPANVVSPGPNTVTPTPTNPLIGKWKQQPDGETIEFLRDNKLLGWAEGDSLTGTYNILDGERLQLEGDSASGHFSEVAPFKITGDRLVVYQTHGELEYQRVSNSAPTADAEAAYRTAIDAGINYLRQGTPWGPVWNRVKARFPGKPNEQIDADLGIEWREPGAYERYIGKQPAPQTAVAGQSYTAPTPRAPMAPVANTPVATAKLFIQALVSGDTNTALQLMPASAQASARALLPNISAALRACSPSVAEATDVSGRGQGGFINVEFTPPCGNYGSFYNALPRHSPDGMSQEVLDSYSWTSIKRYRDSALRVCTVNVGAINEQWRVSYLPTCLPVQ